MKQDRFYKAFEDRYRGSREDIKNRQRFYLSFVELLKEIYPNDKVLDIGCGRGEWLELLSEVGIDAVGIDTNDDMLKVAQEYNLEVIKSDGIEYLKQLPDASLIAISSFHVIEHMAFKDIEIFVSEALRVLKPAGLLILETPNPENIRVSSEYFYLDPTHLKPLPSALMSFVLEYYGFDRVKKLGLQEDISLINQQVVTIKDLFEGVSPDYAVIGQKGADKTVLSKFDDILDKEYGLSIDMLYTKFTTHMDNMYSDLLSVQQQMSRLQDNVVELKSKAEVMENQIHRFEQDYKKLLNSNSWKITYPLRKGKQLLRWFYTGAYHWITFSPTSRPRRVVKSILFKLKVFINRYPKVKLKLVAILDNFPKLKLKLKNIQPNIKVNNNFIDKYTYRTDNTNQNKLSIDEILSRIQKEVELKEEDK